MARRNRKKKVNGFVFPAPFAGVIILVSTCALAYVWLSCRCESLGDELKTLEIERITLQKQYANEEYKWTRMKSPENVERVLAKYNIKMTWPRRDQVVRVYDFDTINGIPKRIADNTLAQASRRRVVMND